MAFSETFNCDVCNKEKDEETTDWWLVWPEPVSPQAGDREQPAIKITPWNSFLAHSAEVRHLCGARCVHTLMDRWMLAEG